MAKNQNSNNEPQVIFLKFADSAVPVFKENKRREWIEYGEKNNYPEYLLTLYNKSAKHNAIINAKSHYIFGNGFENGNNKVNYEGETLNDISRKIVKDRVIFGGARIEIIWGLNKKIAQVYHCDYTQLRKHKEGGFLFKENWDDKYNRDEPVYIPEFNPANPVGSQIFEICDYRPGIKYYPLPDYIGCLNYIETDIEISKFYLSSIKNGMMPSKMIQFYEGANVTDEKKANIERRWQSKFAGAENAGKFILVFNTSKDKQVTVDDLSASELDKHFQELNKTTQQEIYAGHNITSPMLFGIKTEGQLGGTNELQISYAVFQNTYSTPKAKEIGNEISYLMSFSNFPGEYELKPTDPVGINIDIKDVMDKLPVRFILEKVGVPEDMWAESPAGTVAPTQQAAENTNEALRSLTAKQHQQLRRVIREYSKGILTEAAAKTLLKTSLGLSDEDINSILGVSVKMSFGSDAGVIQHFKEKGIDLTVTNEDEVIKVFDEYGDSKNDFEILRTVKTFSADEQDEIVLKDAFLVYDITATENRIIELIKKDPLITPETIASVIGESKSFVESKLKSLVKKGYLEESESIIGTDTVVKRTLPEGVDLTKPPVRGTPPTQIYVKYSYEGPVDNRNRPFCAKLMALNRLYSRAEIEKISERLGYSVFDRRGGFWNKNGKILPHCRHSWKSNVIIKKGGSDV